MSYILDALRKAEQKRQLAAKVPTLATIHRQPVAVRPPIRLRLWPWVAGAVIVGECRHRDVAPAPRPGRGPPHRSDRPGSFSTPGTAAPSAPGATASPAPGPGAAPPTADSPCTLGAGGPSRVPRDAGPSRRRASGRLPAGLRRKQVGRQPRRPRPSPELGLRRRRPRPTRSARSDQKNAHTGRRSCSPRADADRRQARRGAAPSGHSRGAGAGRPLAGSARRGRDPARESSQAGRARARDHPAPHLRTRLRRCRICCRN